MGFEDLGKDLLPAGHGGVVRSGPDVERLFAEHARDVLAYTLRRADPAIAEDVTAEVFAVAWRRRGRIPAQEPVLWLYAIARRVLANERRAARRRAALTSALTELHHERSDGGRSDGATTVLMALDRLRDVDREVLMLSAWEGLSAAQVAVVLGCKVGAVHTRLHRARGRLAVELAETLSSPPTAEPVEGRTG